MLCYQREIKVAGGKLSKQGCEAAAFELEILASCSVRAGRAFRRRWLGAADWVLGFPGAKGVCARPRFIQCPPLNMSLERLSWLQKMRTVKLVVQTHPLTHCTDGEMEAGWGKELI